MNKLMNKFMNKQKDQIGKNNCALRMWLSIACVIFMISLIILMYVCGGTSNIIKNGTGGYVLRLRMFGTVGSDQIDLVNDINDVIADDNIKGLLVHIDSTGGDPCGSEEIYNALHKISQKKLVISIIHSSALSGGYMIAAASNMIFANVFSKIGSIGSIFSYTNISELMENFGVSHKVFRSSPMKGRPSPYEISDDGDCMMQNLVCAMGDEFVQIIKNGRGTKLKKISKNNIVEIFDGSIYTGRDALAMGLVDAIGDEADALEWMYANGLDRNAKVINVGVEKSPPVDGDAIKKILSLVESGIGNNR